MPLRDLVNKFAHVRFEPSGFTGNQEIPIAKSIIDYIFRWLGSRFLGPDDKAALGLIDRSAMVSDAPPAGFGGGVRRSVGQRRGDLERAGRRSGSHVNRMPEVSDEPKASVAVEAPAQRAETAVEPAGEG